MARSTTGVEIKAAALADLATGEQPAVVAERYGLNPATVRSWKNRGPVATVVATDHATGDATLQEHATVIRRPRVEAQQETLNELVVSNLRAKLLATQRISEHVQSEAWLRTQTAADLATLFEAIDRSAIGILDRMAQAHAVANPDPDGTGA